jgi:CHAT domain-containing protein
LSPDWQWRFRLLYAELILDQGQNPDILLLLKLPVPEGPYRPEIEARRTALRGYSEQRALNWEGAEKLYDAAYSAISSVNDPCWQAELLVHHQAQTLLHLGDFETASGRLSRAAALCEACADKYWKALLLFAKGNLNRSKHRYEEAVEWFQQCLDFARAEHINLLTPLTLGNLALSYYNLGDMVKALAALDATDAYYAGITPLQTRQLRDWGQDKGHRARVSAALGKTAEAVEGYRQAIEIAKQTHDNAYMTRWNDERTSLFLEIGDCDSADRFNKEVENHVDPHTDFLVYVSAQLNSAAISRCRNRLESAYRQLVAIRRTIANSQNPDPQLTWRLQIELAHTLGGLKRFSEARAQFEAALKTAESARRSITADGYRLTYFSQLLKLYQAYTHFLVEQKDIVAALRVAESSHARLLTEKLNGPSERQTQVDFEHIARAKRAVILSYFVTGQRSYMWVTTVTGSRLFFLPNQKELANDVRRLNQLIGEQRDLLAEPEYARRLYDKLVAPAEGMIPPGTSVIIVPDGPLSDLNFEALIPPSLPRRYWLESVSMTVVPSLLLLDTNNQTSLRPNTLLLIGAAKQAQTGLPPLASSARELQAIHDRFSNAKCLLLAGADATPSRFVQSDPGSYSIIHISAHALANADSPLDSAIILSADSGTNNYKLYAHALADLHLRADLVTLSACRSSAARNIPGEGLVGLTWAVLRAGAHNVVGTLWKVPEQSSYELMTRMYSHLSAGTPAAEALRAAKLEMVSNQHSLPYDWAAFQVYAR